jgi:hypothetical protein
MTILGHIDFPEVHLDQRGKRSAKEKFAQLLLARTTAAEGDAEELGGGCPRRMEISRRESDPCHC